MIKIYTSMLKNITINKKKEVKAATHPTHDLVASDEKYENKTVVGAMWTRVAKDQQGNEYKFLSGGLSKTRTGTDGKEYQGYVLITEKEWDEYQSLKNGVATHVSIGGFNGEVSNTEDIPF